MSHSSLSGSRPFSAAGNRAPLPVPAHGSHTAHFYSSDSTLIGEVGQRLADALHAGGAAVVIAENSHGRDLAHYVESSGIDLSRAAREDRWVPLDARKTLGVFMAGDSPDPQRFGSLLGGVFDRVAAAVSTYGSKFAPIVTYGEMVAILWEDGNPSASLRLEDLWNDLSRTRTFHLSCGWPLSFFSRGDDGVAVDRICSQHTHVTPSLGYENLSGKERGRGALLWQLKAHNVLEHVSRITRQTLDYYRDAASVDSVSLPEAVDEVLAIYSRRLQLNEVSVTKKIRPGLKVFWSPGECKQILSGLVANAIDASPEGGSMYLSAWECHHPSTGIRGIRFTAGDQGTGIPPGSRSAIFAPFSAGRKDINIGLGLWTVRDLLVRRGGSIRCRSRTAQPSGTLLSVFLPTHPNLTSA